MFCCDASVETLQKKTANQALIHQLICYSESRAKSLTDLTAKSIENLLNNHVESRSVFINLFSYESVVVSIVKSTKITS